MIMYCHNLHKISVTKRVNSCTYRIQPRFSLVGPDVHHVNSVTVDARQDQSVPAFAGIPETTRASIPARVM